MIDAINALILGVEDCKGGYRGTMSSACRVDTPGNLFSTGFERVTERMACSD